MRFTVLGTVGAWVDGEPVRIVRAQRRAVLAYLLLHHERAVGLDELVEALWAGAAPSTATTQLHTAVSGVRSALRDAAGHDVVTSDRAGYRIEASAESLDLAEFSSLVRQGERLQGEPAATALRAGLALWRGTPLSGVSGAFVESARARLTELRADVYERLFAVELELGRHRQVTHELAELVTAYPLRQELVRLLMLALYRTGRPDEAMAAYRRVREALAEELGVDPSDALDDLYRRLLRDDPALSRVETGVDRRLLPRDVPDFTGRTAELAELDRIASGVAHASGAVVIGAVTGVGGMGKTALAVHWAHGAGARYPDGQIFLNLGGYDLRRPLTVYEGLRALLRALGTPLERVPLDETAATELYRSTVAGKRLLLLLDNARSVDQVRSLLPTGPGSLALITSRDALTGLVARDGARVLTLAPLAAADALDLMERVVGRQRLGSEPDAAAELASLCGGLPLALRVGAAELLYHPELPIADLAKEVAADRLARLAVDSDDESTIGVIFERSYLALTERLRRAFRLLGRVPGGDVSLDSITAVVDVPMAEARLVASDLVNASLLERLDDERFQMHDLVKVYAHQKADADEAAAAIERLLRDLLRLATSAAGAAAPQANTLLPKGTPLPAHADSQAALAWFRGEQANLVAAIRFAAQHGPRPYAWQLADMMRGYFWIERDVNDWLATAEAGLLAAEAEQDAAGLAAMHLSAGLAHRAVSRLPEAMGHFDAAVTWARAAEWVAGEATAIGSRAIAHAELGRTREAMEDLETALSLHTRRADAPNIATTLMNLGGLALDLGELRPAAERFADARVRYRETGNRVGEGTAIANLAATYIELGRYPEADTLLAEAMRIHRELADRSAEAVAETLLAELHLRTDRLPTAARHARAGVEVAQQIGARQHETAAWIVAAQIACRQGKVADAATHAKHAMGIIESIGHKGFEAECRQVMAQVRVARRDRKGAVALAEESLAIAEKVGLQQTAAKARTTLAEIRLADGDHAEARRQAEGAVAICERTGYAGCLTAALAVLARCDAQASRGVGSAKSGGSAGPGALRRE
jgi:DNA-binding SARP family transcriptional activator